MPSDTTIRALLAVIAVCLVILVVQSFRDDGARLFGRYQVTALRAGTPLLIRTDTETGQVWKSELRGGRGRWIAFSDPAEGDADGEEVSSQDAGTEPPGESLELERLDQDVLDEDLEVARPAPPPRRPAAPAPSPPAEDDATQFDQLARAAQRTELPPDIRIWALRMLGDNQDPRSTQLLLDSLGDAEPRVVVAAVEALAKRRDARVDEAVQKLREHADPSVQAAVQGYLDASS